MPLQRPLFLPLPSTHACLMASVGKRLMMSDVITTSGFWRKYYNDVSRSALICANIGSTYTLTYLQGAAKIYH